jgi:hypothetical protein
MHASIYTLPAADSHTPSDARQRLRYISYVQASPRRDIPFANDLLPCLPLRSDRS